MINGLAKLLGNDKARGTTVEDTENRVEVALSGTSWAVGPLRDEKGWLERMLAFKKDIRVDVTKCPRLSVYALQWLMRLQQKLRPEGRTLTLSNPSPWILNQIKIAGVAHRDVGLKA